MAAVWCVIAVMALAASLVERADAQGTRCTPTLTALIDAAAYDHCFQLGPGPAVTIWYSYTATDLTGAVECKTAGWCSFGFGGTGGDKIVFWVTGGNTANGGDYYGHKDATAPDATGSQVTINAALETGGYSGITFKRALSTGDGQDAVLDPEQFMRVPYGTRSTDPAAPDDIEEHGENGASSWKMSDPTAVIPGGTGDGGDGSIFGGKVLGMQPWVVIVGGCAVIGGVGLLVYKNSQNEQGEFGGGSQPGMYGPPRGGYGAYSSHGSYGGSRSSKGSRGQHSSSHGRGRHGHRH